MQKEIEKYEYRLKNFNSDKIKEIKNKNTYDDNENEIIKKYIIINKTKDIKDYINGWIKYRAHVWCAFWYWCQII